MNDAQLGAELLRYAAASKSSPARPSLAAGCGSGRFTDASTAPKRTVTLRERIVGKTLWTLGAIRIITAYEGGSSKNLRKAFAAALLSRSAPSMMPTRFLNVGRASSPGAQRGAWAVLACYEVADTELRAAAPATGLGLPHRRKEAQVGVSLGSKEAAAFAAATRLGR